MSGACLVSLSPSAPPRSAAIAAADVNALAQPLPQGWEAHAAASPVSVVIVPGWRNSGPGHWQSLWAERIAGALRVQQEDWLQPHRSPWVASVEAAIEAAPHPIILVAHSLGCIASVHAAENLRARQSQAIAGALFVAPADPERRALFEDFSPVPADTLPFASIVAASSNDPYCPIRMASAYAKSWGSTFVRVPSAGHINIESGHGEWPLGWALLGALAALATVQAQAAA